MSISRKQFLQQSAFALAGVSFPWSKLFSKDFSDPAACLDTLCNYDFTSDTTPFTNIQMDHDTYGVVNPDCTDIKYRNENAIPPQFCGDFTIPVNPGSKCEDPLPSLIYDVYYPADYNYTTCPPLPAVILAHSGAYSDCSSKDLPGLAIYATEFAKRGFITFNIEYRRGVKLDNINYAFTSVEQELAIYRACQDVRGAIRSIIEKYSTFTGPYQINTNIIFLAGDSAGSLAMLNAAYYSDPSLVYPIFPKLAASPTIQAALGPIDATYYNITNPTSNYISHIKGVLNMWGSISLLPSVFLAGGESAYFSGHPNPPVISFHGYNDNVFDPHHEFLIYSPRTPSTEIE